MKYWDSRGVAAGVAYTGFPFSGANTRLKAPGLPGPVTVVRRGRPADQ